MRLVKGASNLMQRLPRLPPAPNVTLLDRRKPKSLSWPHANTSDLHQIVLHRPIETTKWQIVQEGIKSGNVSETCRRHGIAPNLFYRWKDEAEQGAKAALGGRSAAAAETEKDHRIRQLERTHARDMHLSFCG
jgi:hypothetical protein